MTVIATASNPRFHVSRVDIDRDGPTYTIDTLRDMRAIYGGETKLYFITGADALARILSWKSALEMFTMAHFVGVTRPGFELSDAHPAGRLGHAGRGAGHGHLLVRVPDPGGGWREPVWYLVPDGVVQYINKRGLYRGSEMSHRCETLVAPGHQPRGRNCPSPNALLSLR
jgi:nicotinate-nucleotide adenylyltransferase